MENRFNKHLKDEGCEDEVTNFSSDIKDSVKYAILLHSLNPKLVPPIREKVESIFNTEERAKIILDFAEVLECKEFVTASDIANVYIFISNMKIANISTKFPPSPSLPCLL